MDISDDDDSPYEVGVDDDTGAVHAVYGGHILDGLLRQGRRERAQTAHDAPPQGRWRQNWGRTHIEHRTLDQATLCHSLTERLVQIVDETSHTGDGTSELQHSDSVGEWLTP
eukprot:3509938-Amphidinium_carterae.1